MSARESDAGRRNWVHNIDDDSFETRICEMLIELVRSDPWGLGMLIMKTVGDEYERMLNPRALH